MAFSPTFLPADPARRRSLTGILCVLGGTAWLSVNDMAIKHLSADYALHQVILIRAVIGMVLLAGIVAAMRSGFGQVRTRRPGAHLLRVGLVLVSNVTFFVGLAALPLADAIAIAFVAPLFVTALSVVILGERVGPRRWAAVAAGMLGVLIMARPGAGAIQPAAILVMVSALCYAGTHMMTRRMRDTESAVTLNFYVQVGFIAISLAMGLAFGDGRLAGTGDASLDFLFRGWHWPAPSDWPYFAGTALSVTLGGVLVSQAYRLNEAALVAPFEYMAMPLAIFWGAVMFGTWPTGQGWVGIALICGAGLYTLWRETRLGKDRR